MPTQQIASFNGGQVIFEYDFDGDPPRVRRVRCRNAGDAQSKITVFDSGSNVLITQYETPANETIEVIVPNGRQLRLNDDGDYELPYTVRCEA